MRQHGVLDFSVDLLLRKMSICEPHNRLSFSIETTRLLVSVRVLENGTKRTRVSVRVLALRQIGVFAIK